MCIVMRNFRFFYFFIFIFSFYFEMVDEQFWPLTFFFFLFTFFIMMGFLEGILVIESSFFNPDVKNFYLVFL